MKTKCDYPETELKPKEFLDWIYNRLKFRYSEEADILCMLKYIVDSYALIKKNIKISDEKIESICKKHYADFDMDKTSEMNIGYTEEEKNNIKNFVLSIIKEALLR